MYRSILRIISSVALLVSTEERRCSCLFHHAVSLSFSLCSSFAIHAPHILRTSTRSSVCRPIIAPWIAVGLSVCLARGLCRGASCNRSAGRKLRALKTISEHHFHHNVTIITTCWFFSVYFQFWETYAGEWSRAGDDLIKKGHEIRNTQIEKY